MSECGSVLSTPDIVFACDPPPTIGDVVTCISGAGMAGLQPGVAPVSGDDGAYATDASGVQITSNAAADVGSATYPAGLGANCVVAGSQSICGSDNSVCIGYLAQTASADAVAVGAGTVSALSATYGASNNVTSAQGVVVGTENTVNTPGSFPGTVCIGNSNILDSDTAVLLGTGNTDHSVECITLGHNISITADVSYSVFAGTDHQLSAAQGNSIVCMGRNVELVNTCSQSTIIGVDHTLDNCESSVCVGAGCSGNNSSSSVMVGNLCQSSGIESVIFGNDCTDAGAGICLGRDITNSGSHVAVGRGISATGSGLASVCIGSNITDSGFGNVIIGHGISNSLDNVSLLTARNNGGYTQLSADMNGVHCGGAPGTKSGYVSHVTGVNSLSSNTTVTPSAIQSLKSSVLEGRLVEFGDSTNSLQLTLPSTSAMRSSYVGMKQGDSWNFVTVVGLGSPSPADYTMSGSPLDSVQYCKWRVNLGTGWVDGGAGTVTREIMRNTSCKWKVTSNSNLSAGPIEILRLTPQTCPFVLTANNTFIGTLTEVDGSTVTAMDPATGSVLATVVVVGGVVNSTVPLISGIYYFISRAPGKSDCIICLSTGDS